MFKNKTIGVIYGGFSSEREISIKSGEAVINSLKENGHRVEKICIQSPKEFLNIITKKKIDFAFIALHGNLGEDGTVQSILELLKIPYSGSGVLASALGMNKIYTKKLLKYHNIPTPDWIEINTFKKYKKINIKYPSVVKPSDQGSAIGVNIVKNAHDLKKAIKIASKFSKTILIEDYIPGKELTVGILGNKTLPILEILPLKSDFYDFKAKYKKGGSKHILPKDIPENIYKKIQMLSLKAFEILGCKAFARVDFRLSPDNKPYILEINTIPGLTETSLLPEAANIIGIDFYNLILKIIKYSLSSSKVSAEKTQHIW